MFPTPGRLCAPPRESHERWDQRGEVHPGRPPHWSCRPDTFTRAQEETEQREEVGAALGTPGAPRASLLLPDAREQEERCLV